MNIITVPAGVLRANCYLLSSCSDRTALIDPGGDTDMLMQVVRQKKLEPVMILLTHGHFDHTASAAELSRIFDLPVYIHQDDADMLTDGRKNLSIPMGQQFDAVERYTTLEDGDTLSLDEISITLLHTPGHSPGSSVLLAGDVMFTGDTLFHRSIGRTDFEGGDFLSMMQSLARLRAIEGEYRVYPGHNEPTTLSEERNNNPYLKADRI